MKAEIKIPPAVNAVFVLFAIPQTQGWPLISCTGFIQALLPTLPCFVLQSPVVFASLFLL